MYCEKCQTKPAVVHFKIRNNHEQKELHLCAECYAEVRNKMGASSPSGMFGSQQPFNGMFSGNGGFTPPHEAGANEAAPQEHQGLLDELGRNVTNAARAGLIDPVIGRDQEVERVIEILNRRNKNNPVLIGEPGVGKTAIAEGLALKITEGDVPSKLLNKELYVLDVASLVADTGIRGQFEERMQELIKELQERKNVILFVDEIHLLVGAGSAQGSMDAGNILKPALARGELQLIGATTLKEYRDIEKDAALERRLQPVIVNEPTVEETIEILNGIRDKYEEYHGVSYEEETIRACALLSHRYIQDRHLPDKAIDLLDEAGSKANLKSDVTQDEASIQNRLGELHQQKEKATKEENYELAARLRDEEKQLEKKLSATSDNNKINVSAEDIQSIIEKKTGIPVRKLQLDEQQKMKNLDKKLSEKVIGQEEAVKKVTKAVRRSRAGLKAKTRPIGSFLFVGPTGVGKTELTRALAEELFGSREAMIRLDMSEYMEKHSVSKLIGSPPGYVGHDEAGQLTEKVRRKPYSIILLDEIEKAHPDVQHMFLQILEDGRLTDSQGRTVSFKDSVIIMTSNAGTADRKKKLGFGTTEEYAEESSILESLGSFFKPEFLNRFDSIIQFSHLKEKHLLQIVEIMTDELAESLKEQELTLEVSDNAKQKLAELGYHPAFGARPLRRVIQEHLEDNIADLLLDEENVKSLRADVKDGKIVVNKAN